MRDCCMVREINLLSLIPFAVITSQYRIYFSALGTGFSEISDKLVTKMAGKMD
jgi:hypothetical protein